ncbi:PKD domain containing protein [Methanosalsum zhilinae DSM 4017]|uniref:PKD domain containing protein n=1 Tax=Methanosalsum zhilinae (strain DSM 4017 / NBRC 107636 / OCM 62 / WeN5) TaxID=679901 RepID=F7XNC5_METZD|nr:PKD domain-containing protein [Methanosalsum zhilinae]AEH61175.1 PKD domain containing protein [Methanosalsum zhilinae DSM 4017]
MINKSILKFLMLLVVLSLFALQAGANQNSEPAEYEIIIQGFEYNPSELTIYENDTVIWINMDAETHTVTADEFDSGDLQDGDSFSYTFNETGTYDYMCIYHPQMQGTVIVEAEVDDDVPPVADFTANPTSGVAPLEVTFTDNSENAVEYHWDFGDGNTSAEVNPTHTYLTPDVYTVTLTVSNEVGEDSAEETITVGHPVDDEPSPIPGFGIIFAITSLFAIAALVKKIRQK